VTGKGNLICVGNQGFVPQDSVANHASHLRTGGDNNQEKLEKIVGKKRLD